MGVRGPTSMWRRGARAALLIAVVAASSAVTGWARAAEPPSGVISPDSPSVEWRGPYAESSTNVQGGCNSELFVCDTFRLHVDVPPDYWIEHEGGAEIDISWEEPSNDFCLVVKEEESGEEVASDCSGLLPEAQTSRSVIVPDASGSYVVEVEYWTVVESDYRGFATFFSGKGRAPADVVFDTISPPAFAPATIVSAHFLGTEPMMVMERPLPDSPPDVMDPDRIFVDWIHGTTTTISQLTRSLDGGDSFRLLIDPACAERSRPTCQRGGGDSDSEVNPFTGTVYFADLHAQSVTIASSTDHGNTFPTTRQSQAALVGADRQWVGASDPDFVSVGGRKIEAFLSYQVTAGAAHVIQGINEDGQLVSQSEPQIARSFGQFGGPIRVDVTTGPGRGWIYKPLDSGDAYEVATALAAEYQDPSAWEINEIPQTDEVRDFPWLQLDESGNAYALWTTGLGSGVFYSFSSITDPANDPEKDGRPGTLWSHPRVVSLPSLGSTVFPEVTAGGPGRIAITYMGTEDFKGQPSNAPEGTRWNTYGAVITNALREAGPAIVRTARVNHRIAHVGPICTAGALGCEDNDRSLADMIDIGHDSDGRVGIVFTDNHSTFAEDVAGSEDLQPFPHFTKQTDGPGLLLSNPEIDVSIPDDERTDPSGDSTWPNTSAGAYLPAFDLQAVGLRLEEDEVVARLPLADASPEAMTANLGAYNASFPSQPNGQRLQYVVRFSTADEIYHLSMEHLPNGSRRFFGGMLDANDRLAAGDSPETEGLFKGAGYHTDEDFAVTGTIEDETIVLRADPSDFGLRPGTDLFSVTGFAMAGPLEEEETTILNTMRTIDATPPLDTVFGQSECDLLGTTGDDVLEGTGADELICGLGGDDTITGAGGNDTVIGGMGEDTISGGDGDDDLDGAEGDDVIEGDSGHDEIEGGADLNQISGGEGDDAITGGFQRDVIAAGPGQDEVEALGGADEVLGQEDPDRLVGAEGDDLLEGGPGDDTIEGGGGQDVIRGHGGADNLDAGDGGDEVEANAGDDVVSAGTGTDSVRAGVGDDRVRGGAQADSLRGGAGIDDLGGRAGGDRLFGNRDADSLRGGTGADTLNGGWGADDIRGRSDSDSLIAGPGHDLLHGGKGFDSCSWSADEDTASSCESRGR